MPAAVNSWHSSAATLAQSPMPVLRTSSTSPRTSAGRKRCSIRDARSKMRRAAGSVIAGPLMPRGTVPLHKQEVAASTMTVMRAGPGTRTRQGCARPDPAAGGSGSRQPACRRVAPDRLGRRPTDTADRRAVAGAARQGSERHTDRTTPLTHPGRRRRPARAGVHDTGAPRRRRTFAPRRLP